MKSLFMAGAAAVVLTLAACGGGSGNNTAGVTPPGTPTFYINGKTLSGEKTLEQLAAEIDPLLA